MLYPELRYSCVSVHCTLFICHFRYFKLKCVQCLTGVQFNHIRAMNKVTEFVSETCNSRVDAAVFHFPSSLPLQQMQYLEVRPCLGDLPPPKAFIIKLDTQLSF